MTSAPARVTSAFKLGVVAVLALASPASADPVVPADTQQLITGVIADWDATQVTLQRWHRDDHGWVADGPSWQGVIGKGAAWGSGLHGTGAPAGRTGAAKREGDARSPAGAFALRGTYGYAAKPPAKTSVPYTHVTATWQCVDDPRSSHYTQIVDRAALTVDWSSSEPMRRRDALYTWVIDIAHNPAATPDAGSCIFFHVWRNAKSPTVGCTAMPAPKLASLISSLDPHAIYVLLPRAEYAALATPWGLPALAP